MQWAHLEFLRLAANRQTDDAQLQVVVECFSRRRRTTEATVVLNRFAYNFIQIHRTLRYAAPVD